MTLASLSLRLRLHRKYLQSAPKNVTCANAVHSQFNRYDGSEYVFGDAWNATNRRYGWAFEIEWIPPTENGIGSLNASWAYQVP